MSRNFRGVIGWILAGLITIGITACKDSKTDGIEYQAETQEEVVAAIKEVYANESGDPVEVSAGIEGFFGRLGKASRGSDPVNTESFFSVEGMFRSMDSGGFFEGTSRREKKAIRSGLQSKIGVFGQSIKQMAFDHHRVLRVEELGDGNRLVYVKLYDNELNITSQVRWWLIETEKGWRVYDFEDLSVGLRVVSLMGTMMKGGMSKHPDPWIADFLPVSRGLQSFDYSDPESYSKLKKPLEKLRTHKLPPEVKRFASLMMTSVYQAEGAFEESIDELNAAKNGRYKSPLWHYLLGHSLMGLEKYEEALDNFDKHVEIFGNDADIFESVSDCHLMLDNIEEARRAALLGLEDNPQSINCLAAFSAASSPAQIASEEFQSRFAACEKVEWAYEIAFDYLISLEKNEQANALYKVISKKYPGGDLEAYCAEILAGDSDETEE